MGLFPSLRAQLMLLVLLPAVPITTLLAYQAIGARDQAAETARRELVALAEFASLHLDREIRATKQQIGILNDVPAVNRMIEPGCSTALADLKRRATRYLDIVVVDLNGVLRCSSGSRTQAWLSADRNLRRRAVAASEAVAGMPVIRGSASGLPVAIAIRDRHGAARGVLVALFDLDWFATPYGSERFGARRVLALWDMQGLLLYHYPDAATWIRQLPPDTPFARVIRSTVGAGTAEVPGVDGVNRLDGFAASRPDGELPLRISVGVGIRQLYSDAERYFRRSLVGLATVVLVALAVAWMLGEIVVRRRIAALVHAAERLTGGDLAIRAVDDHGGEIGQLARVFNRMAASLEAQMGALRASEARFRDTLDHMLEGCQIIDFDWRYVYVNDSVAAHGRRSRLELLGRTMMEVYPGIENTDMFAALRRCMTDRVPHRMENRFDYPDGSWAWFDISIHPSPEGIFVVSIDVTDRKQAEALLREMNAELERRVVERTAQLSASNAELERFAYVASHDLQEPLRMVASYVQLLERRYRDRLDDEAREFIGFAVDGAVRMQGLINGLLQYSRIQARGREYAPTDLNRVLDEVRTDLEVSIRECGATVTNDRLPTVMADATQLRQLLQNLVGNALKYRGERSPNVHVTARRIEEGAVECPDDAPPKGWLLSVRDNGIGIDAQYYDRVFQLFQRLHTRQEYPGTGLGLALCKRIAERHGGAIWVRSEPGKGSVFHVALPDDEAAAGGHAAPARIAGAR